MHYLTWDFSNVNWGTSLSQSRPCSGSHLTLSIVVKMASNAWHHLSALSSTLTSLHSSLYSSHSGLPVVPQTMRAPTASATGHLYFIQVHRWLLSLPVHVSASMLLSLWDPPWQPIKNRNIPISTVLATLVCSASPTPPPHRLPPSNKENNVLI